MQEQQSFRRRIVPLSGAQFLGMFNDNAFKMVALSVIFGASSANNEFASTFFTLLMTFIFALPAVLFVVPAGFFADRLPKRYVMLASKLLEVIVLFCALSLLGGESGTNTKITVLVIAFCLSLQSVLFAPAVYGSLPEIFRESELPQANGTLSFFSLLGGTLGLCSVPVCEICFSWDTRMIIWMLIASSALSFVFALYVTQMTSFVQAHRELAYKFGKTFAHGWFEMTRTKALFLAVLGDAAFISFGTAIVILLVFFAKTTLKGMDAPLDIPLLQMAPLAGLALGAYFTGRLTKKIELGLVPFGAAGVGIFLTLAAYVPGKLSILSFEVPGVYATTIHIYWLCALFLGLAGFCGGAFLIPLRAFYQQRVHPEARGAALAMASALKFIIAVLLNAVILLLLSGTKNSELIPASIKSSLPDFVNGWVANLPDMLPQILIAGIGIATMLVTFFAMPMMPDFALRFLLLTLVKVFYRVRSKGLENIPERGAALLVANHTSLIDAVLICTCTSRRVRFLLQEEFFQRRSLRILAKLTGFIKVPAAGRTKELSQMFETVQQALRDGEIVCVFPEGMPTRNGMVGRFTSGFERMLPSDVDVPLIPVSIGKMWGSIFSYYYGSIRLRLPKEMPYYVRISVGKPLPKGISAFEVRQTITELEAEAAGAEMPHEHPVHYFLAKNAKLHPFQIIMRDAATGKSFSFFKTYLASVLFSREIRARTTSDSKYVGVLLPNCSAAVLSIMGTLLADKVPCPLNFTTSQEILERSIKKAKMELVLTNRVFLSKVRLQPTPEMVFLEDIAKTVPLWKKIITMIGIIVLPYKELLNMVAPLSQLDNEGEAVLLFSSGSTGIPKGVQLTHHNLFTDVAAMTKCITFNPRKDSIVGNLPLFHSFGINTGLWLPMIIRCQPVIYVNSPLDTNVLGEAILKYKPNILVATPSFLQTYLRKFKPEVFDQLRLVVSGAEKLRPDIAEKFKEALHGRLEIVEGYGCTELSPVVTFNTALNVADTGRSCGKKGAIGLGLTTVCTRIMDPLTYKPVPPDSEGLLFIKGPMVMRGYLDEPEQTKQVMINGYYNTGDIAKMDETGYVTICGRLSRFSKIAGEMVPHEMVECIINELCKTENRVVAVGSIPDAQKGEALLVLYTPEMPLTPDEVVAELRERSISNLWIPKAVNFEKVEKLPLLGSGKLDLTLLRTVADAVAERRRQEAAK